MARTITAVIGERLGRAGTLTVCLAISAAIIAVLLETVLHLPLRLPGHRAFPGALAILLFAETFVPVVLLALCVAVPLVGTLTGLHPPLVIAAWTGPALLLVLSSHRRIRHSVWYFAAVGALYGLARFFSLLPGYHHTPMLIRLGGHLAFGAVAGLIAYGTMRLLRREKR